MFGCTFSGLNGCVVGDGLLDSVVSVLCVLVLWVDLEIGPDSLIGGVLGSASKFSAVCVLAK